MRPRETYGMVVLDSKNVNFPVGASHLFRVSIKMPEGLEIWIIGEMLTIKKAYLFPHIRVKDGLWDLVLADPDNGSHVLGVVAVSDVTC